MSDSTATPAPMRVLIADDEMLNRRILRAILRKDGVASLEAADGDEALALVRGERPDLVLLDVMMPGKDGYAVCTELKSDPALADIPVIFISSRDNTEDRVRGLKLGANDYVSKPFDAEEVLVRVRTHLKLRQLNQSLMQLNSELLARQARMEEDLRAAADIQRALLPGVASPLPSFQVASRFEPYGTVSGDLFNIHRLGPCLMGVFVLDVSGHGVSSAMVTVSVARTLSPEGGMVVRERPLTPSEVMRELEREYPFERFERFFTLSYLLVDTARGTVRYSSAAHPPPLLVPREGPARVLSEGGPLLGVGAGGLFEEGQVRLTPGDRLFLYTDGAFEVSDEAGDHFGQERLHALLQSRRELPLEALCDEVLEALRRHRGNLPVEDDLTLLALEFQGEAT